MFLIITYYGYSLNKYVYESINYNIFLKNCIVSSPIVELYKDFIFQIAFTWRYLALKRLSRTKKELGKKIDHTLHMRIVWGVSIS